jgi:hypothetical protein
MHLRGLGFRVTVVVRRPTRGIAAVRSHCSNLTKVGRVAQEVNKLRKARRQSPPELGLLLVRERVHACGGNACFILPGLTVAPLALLSLIWAGRRLIAVTCAPGLEKHLRQDWTQPRPIFCGIGLTPYRHICCCPPPEDSPESPEKPERNGNFASDRILLALRSPNSIL